MPESGILTKLRVLRLDAEKYEWQALSPAEAHEWREVQLLLDLSIEVLKRPGSIDVGSGRASLD